MRPKFITFDLYGTLIDFQIGAVTARLVSDRIDAASVAAFLTDYSNYRFDEVLGDWKPYADVLARSLERTCTLWGVPFRPSDAEAIVAAVPTWGPHPDVPAALARLAAEFPLVVLSNAADAQVQANVDRLGAPIHAVLTAEQAQAYKPRLRAFEYMFDTLGCEPEDVMHVSSSLRYDLMSAHDLGIAQRIFVDRGHGPGNPAFGYRRIEDLAGLPDLVLGR